MSAPTPVITLEGENSSEAVNSVPVITLDENSSKSSEPITVISLDDNEEDISDSVIIAEAKRKNDDEVKTISSKKSCNPMHSGLLEADVGINQFVSSTPGFEAIIKHRYSDFHVNEIDLDYNVTKLTSLTVPDEKEEEISAEAVSTEEILAFIPEEQLEALKKIVADHDKSQTILINVTSLDKANRTKIHQLLKLIFKSAVFSNTIDKSGEKFIEVGLSSKIDDRFNRQKWTQGEYLHFVLHKENMDHSQTVNLFSQLLKMKANFFSVAGTKDKRAKTTQWMSVRRVKADRIAKLRLKNIWLGHYCYKKVPLRLGDLKGNQFRIALRNVSADDNLINEALDSVKRRGFINYFGLQRFGSSVVAPTHIIGKTLLQGKWKEAVELILKPRPTERGDREMNAARETWWKTRNAKQAAKCLRNPMKSIEGKLFLALDKLGPNAYVNALEKLPRTTGMLYVHSYQSYVWNKVLSRRIEAFGLAPIAGDLVVADDVDIDTVCGKVELLTEAVLDPESEVTEESRLIIDKKVHSFTEQTSDLKNDDLNKTEPGKEENGTVAVDGSKRKIKVKKLKQEDLPNTKIEDIIYPLPGYDVEYPDNEINEWYKEILAADDLTSQSLKQSVKSFSTPGSYRKMLCIPKNVSWNIIKYLNENDCLILSDIEEIKEMPQPKSIEDGKLKGITLEVSLPSCSYATMFLREITKSSTAASHQANLTAKASEATVNS